MIRVKIRPPRDLGGAGRRAREEAELEVRAIGRRWARSFAKNTAKRLGGNLRGPRSPIPRDTRATRRGVVVRGIRNRGFNLGRRGGRQVIARFVVRLDRGKSGFDAATADAQHDRFVDPGARRVWRSRKFRRAVSAIARRTLRKAQREVLR